MARDYHTAQDDFGSIVQRLQPMVLTNFVMWLDMKVAEFKVYGQMLLEQESRDLPNWYLRPNFNAETMVNAIKQKLQTPVSPTPEHLHSKSASHGPVSPTRRNRSAHSQSAKKLRTDSEKNADFSESAVVIQSQIEDPIIPLEDTDSSNHLISSDCTRAESPSYISTNVKVTDTDSRYRTLNKSSDLPHVVEPLYSSRLLPKSEPVDEEFEILENRSRTTTSTISKSADNPELHVRVASQDIAVSSSNKITNTEKVAKTLVQSDGTMFMMPQTDKDVTDTSVVSPGLSLPKLNFTSNSLSGAVNFLYGSHGDCGVGQSNRRKQLVPELKRKVSIFSQQNNSQRLSCTSLDSIESGVSPQKLIPKNISMGIEIANKKFAMEKRALQSDNRTIDLTSWKEDSVDMSDDISSDNERVLPIDAKLMKCLPPAHVLKSESTESEFMDQSEVSESDLDNAMVYTSPDGELYYACWICEKSFRLRSGLKRHVEGHFAQRTVNCDICGQAFTNKHNLKSHQRMHDDKTFQCILCTYKTCRKSDLKKHLQRMHGFDYDKSSKLCEL